ncbi:MAG TPA: diguanylate phosphodiesterase [Planctomycetaceae bacterium]|nr:diguanylate phosphodiesterase [Planctomycetaceae bacterium]
MSASLVSSPASHPSSLPTWSLCSVRDGAVGSEDFTVEPNLPFTIGRNAGCTVRLNSHTVSGAHAELRPHQDALWIRDLQSTNGTFVNGERISAPISLQDNDFVQFADVVFRVSKHSKPTGNSATMQQDVCDEAFALVQFDRLMVDRMLTPAYQPIVNVQDGAVIGVEVLARSDLMGMQTPQAMFTAASRLNMEIELSRLLRWEGIRQAIGLRPDVYIFLNTHPAELQEQGLLGSIEQIRTIAPEQMLVLELHEASITAPDKMRVLKKQLAELNVKLAYDDFGAGQARLSELVEAPPDFLKFDMSMIRDIDSASAERRRLIKSLVDMALGLGINPLAEGVETQEEAAVCRELGFVTGQGFYWGRPKRIS